MIIEVLIKRFLMKIVDKYGFSTGLSTAFFVLFTEGGILYDFFTSKRAVEKWLLMRHFVSH